MALESLWPRASAPRLTWAWDDLTRSLAESLDSGYVLSVDYGHEASDLYSSSRSRGTLMCHYRHTANSQPFRRIGRQDITAHVDFTTLMQMGKRWELQSCGLVSQRNFLGNLGIVGNKEWSPRPGDCRRVNTMPT